MCTSNKYNYCHTSPSKSNENIARITYYTNNIYENPLQSMT